MACNFYAWSFWIWNSQPKWVSDLCLTDSFWIQTLILSCYKRGRGTNQRVWLTAKVENMAESSLVILYRGIKIFGLVGFQQSKTEIDWNLTRIQWNPTQKFNTLKQNKLMNSRLCFDSDGGRDLRQIEMFDSAKKERQKLSKSQIPHRNLTH